MLDLFKTLDKNGKDNTGDSISKKIKSGDTDDDSGTKCAKILSTANQINSLFDSFVELNEFNNELDRFISCSSAYYWFFKEQYNISRVPNNKILLDGIKKYEFLKNKNLGIQYSHIMESFEEHQNVEFELCIPGCERFDAARVRYFQCLCNVKQDNLECFISEDSYLFEYHSMEATKSIDQLKDSSKCELNRSKQLMSQFFSNTEDGLITELLRFYIEARQSNKDAVSILELIDCIAYKYKDAVSYFEEKYEESLNVNFSKLNTLLGSLRPNNSASDIKELSSSEYISAELEGSLDRILNFSDLPNDKIDFFKSQLAIFKKMENKDKFELIRPEVKNKITSVYFEIYEAVFKRMLKENVNDKAVDMFLVFGFMDNALLTNQQIGTLSRLLDFYTKNGSIYSMKQWLTKIYNSEKTPSLNELSVDYEQILKERRANGHSAGNKVNNDYDSGDSRLNFEIMNMLKTNHKLCYGQISTYFPVLNSDMLPNDISRVALTVDKINDSLRNILNIDFSAFHREVFYTGDNPAFKKEFIMKQVIPDIILIPMIGTKAIMWQETSGRSKLTPGRFLLPILTCEDINSIMTRLIGSFRWELCRAVEGARWNDIAYKSLTSEYADYIQDYKKNKNLSQENKEKIKIQIQRYRNNLRDIFSSDYEAWIKYEAKGVKKLNKDARSILYKYCPLNRAIRDDFVKQPSFSNVATQFETERKKFAKELEARYAYYVKQGHTLESELEENLRFYKEL